MNKLPRLQQGYYTQVEEVAIENRLFVKEVAGVRATKEHFRIATDAEIAEWEALKAKQEEEESTMFAD